MLTGSHTMALVRLTPQYHCCFPTKQMELGLRICEDDESRKYIYF